VKSNHKAPTVQDAEQIARLIVNKFPGVDALLLCGSVARGDATEWSDIDLVVTGSDPDLTPGRLRQAVPQHWEHVSLLYYPTSLFSRLYNNRALFIAHLRVEGIALYDRLGLLKKVLAEPYVPVVDVAGEIKAHRAKLAPYTDPRRFNNDFLFCLSHLYSIGKGVVMLGLAKRGVLEFNREEAFRRFAKLNPDLATETEKVFQLRPFYHMVTCHRPEPLPFSYERAAQEMQEAVSAIETLARRAENL
jgi:predicted nucleotidyltransferase